MKKRDKSPYIERCAIVLLVLVLFITGCNDVNVENKSFESLNYEVTECLDNDESTDFEDNLEISFVEGDILINQIIEFNCCFEVELSYKKTDYILRIYEDFSGEECDCNCKKEITATINGKDVSEIEFYSRETVEYPYELLLEKQI